MGTERSQANLPYDFCGSTATASRAGLDTTFGVELTVTVMCRAKGIWTLGMSWLGALESI